MQEGQKHIPLLRISCTQPDIGRQRGGQPAARWSQEVNRQQPAKSAQPRTFLTLPIPKAPALEKKKKKKEIAGSGL